MNYVAIIAGALSVMILGAIWFNPKVLGKPWMEGAGLSEEEANKMDPMALVGGLIMALIISWATSRYATHTEEGMSQFVHGLYHGVMPALLFIAPVLISKGLFEKKSITWILIGAAYWVLAITLMGGIVYALTPLPEAAAAAG
ncbi:MAG: DUF1761 domain-containing protein [Bacteroidota bacterium]